MIRDRKYLFAGFFFFLFCGIIYTQVTSRLPALKAQTGITDGDVGLALMCMGGGSLAGFLTVNFILRYLQVRQLLRLSSCGFLLVCLLLSIAQSTAQVFLLFGLWGWCCSYFDVTMNTHAIYVELKTQHPYMSSMHACYSAGCLLGSGLGSMFAFLGVPLYVNFLIIAAVLISLFLYFQGALLPDPLKENKAAQQSAAQEAAAEPAKPRRFIPIFVVFCGLMGMFSYTAEGSVAEWGSLVLHQAKHASEGVSALAYGVFALCMAGARFCGDHLRARAGDRLMILGGGSLALVGMLIVILSPYPLFCLCGYMLMGIGLAPVFPIAVSNAGKRRDISPKAATATVSFVGYAGLLIIPPFLGFLAQHFGLERALLLPLGAIIIVIAGSFAFKNKLKNKVKRA